MVAGFLLIGAHVLRAKILPQWSAWLLLIGTLALVGANDQNAQVLFIVLIGPVRRGRAGLSDATFGLGGYKVEKAINFPTGGGSGFSDGTAGGECESWSDCILVRYSGENGAVGMGIALAAGVAAALSVALMIRLLLLGDDPKHLSSDGFRGDHG